MMHLKYPVGIYDFKILRERAYFVGKSYFIKDILDHQATQVSLITRPRRFGKTLMLSMLKYYFDI
ncbi:MAG: AAA family ATPase [Desulfovibrionaceae bacterium]|nr:AAA family ATPase [Desulfovibrionaceae bacterium]